MTIRTIQIPSLCLGRNLVVNICIPDQASGRWMLLLHGYGGNQCEWLEKSTIAEHAQKYGLTLVMPGCGDGYYEDTQEPMGCFLGEELPAFICNEFALSSRREDTYVAGASMGGFGALLIGSRYSNVYGKIVSFGGAFIISDVAIGNQGVLGSADVNYFKRVFGDFATLEGSERDPLAQAEKAMQEDRMGSVYLVCGTEDILIRCNERMYEELSRMGVCVRLKIVSGNHSWSTWNHHIEDSLRW